MKATVNGTTKERKVLRRKAAGFTLIELVLVIAILGVLAVTALPNFFNISLTAARTNAMNATVGSIQAGLGLYAANQVASGSAVSYPPTLDAASVGAMATGTNRLFTTVLQNGVNAQWYKQAAAVYAFDTNGNGAYDTGAVDTCFQYTVGTGTFIQMAACP